MQTGRGCRHGCRYCSITAFARGTHRSRPLEHVLEELKTIPRHFMFVDDNIIADPEYAKRLFRAMAPMRKRWISQCSMKIADDPELLALARAAGCRGLFIGMETISQENLDAVDKGFNDEQRLLRRIAAIQPSGHRRAGGHDRRPRRRRRDRLPADAAVPAAARIDALQLAILTPQPGTPLFDEFERAGRIIDRDWSHYDFRHVVMRPARMTARQLQEGRTGSTASSTGSTGSSCGRSRRVRRRPDAGLFDWRLNMTYRYDNRREGIVGRNPGGGGSGWSRGPHAWVAVTPACRAGPTPG